MIDGDTSNRTAANMIIIGRGTQIDPYAHKLYTALNRYVANERPDAERAPESLREARKIAKKVSPTAVCRSLTSKYNCMGMVFATRRTSVSIEHIRMFLVDDAYSQVEREKAVEGDIVIYLRDSSPQHVGLVHRREDLSPRRDGSMIQMWVLSQWGEDGEYCHKIDEVPPFYGTPSQFWSERTPE